MKQIASTFDFKDGTLLNFLTFVNRNFSKSIQTSRAIAKYLKEATAILVLKSYHK